MNCNKRIYFLTKCKLTILQKSRHDIMGKKALETWNTEF